MDAAKKPLCDVASADWQDWNHISWSQTQRTVGRLQTRIAKAANDGNWRKLKRLQRLLVRSTSGRCMAVRRVTENRGRKTPGIDGASWSTPVEKWKAVEALGAKTYRPKPLRRIHIPKSNGGNRPLGIPTMSDRAMQALHLLALEPVAETLGDIHSYGFRPYRSTADAIVQCANVLGRGHSAKWVLEADIKGCFDNIDHDWLCRNIPMDRTVLRKWLKSGFVENHRLYPTEAGTPQGGIISPVLANLALDGLGRLLSEQFKSRQAKVHLVRYADDFIVTGSSKELLECEVKPMVEAFLEQRGLTLSKEKTKITHIEDGFDFLGWNVRRFSKMLVISPSKKNQKAFYAKIRSILWELRTARQDVVIAALNPVIRGWACYHRSQMATRTFTKMDHRITLALWRWAKRRHPNKGRKWIKKRYFRSINGRDWIFATSDKVLVRLTMFKIVRHTKIKSDANPFDPAWEVYFEEREKRSIMQTKHGKRRLFWLWQKQKGRCTRCNHGITRKTGWHIHHTVFRCRGGSNKTSNLELLHPICHRQLHAADVKV
jgi:RNA-directed DNA polymerase